MNHSSKSSSRRWTPYLFVAPMVVVILVLVYYPTISTMTFGFQEMNLVKPNATGFVGLRNFGRILENGAVWTALLNSVVILGIVLIGTVIGGLFTALVLLKDTFMKGILTAVIILPWALPPVVNGILWRWMFHPSFGFVNKLLLHLGIIHQGIQWLTNPYLVLLIASFVVIWRTVPLAAILILSGLQSIPDELHESAVLDGSSALEEFTGITLPLLRPVIAIVVTLTSITGISLFDEIVSFTGFSFQTRTVMMQIYLETFRFLNFGRGSALVTMFMVITGTLAFFYIRTLYRSTEYL